MKPILTLLLLPALCMAQPFEQNSHCFNPDEISNLYQVGKKYEWYKQEYPKLVDKVFKLDSINQAQHVSIIDFIDFTIKSDGQLKGLYDQRQEYAVKAAVMEAEKWGFWEWVLFWAGCLTSGYLGYQIGK